MPRTAVKQDLLFTLGSAMSIFAPSKNDAVARLEHLLSHGQDPGSARAHGGQELVSAPSGAPPAASSDEAAVDQPELSTDIEEVAFDRITARIAEDFAGHDLASLIAALLRAEGYYCIQAPPGPDGGVDITAGRGPLGLDNPRLVVQVKSGGSVGAPVVSQLDGVMSTNGADQGLLVAWGGVTKPARDALANQKLRVRLWEASDVVDAVLRTYSRLPEEIRGAIPLRQIWTLSS